MIAKRTDVRLDQGPTLADLLAAKRELEVRYFDRVHRAHREASHELKRAPIAQLASDWLNVVGIGIGTKRTAGRCTPEAAVVVLVQRKLPKSALTRSRVPPPSVAGIPTDVVETGIVRSAVSPVVAACLRNPKARMPRPFPAGVSIGGRGNPAGTLGYLVRSEDGTRFLLSNYHVLGSLSTPGAPLEVTQPGWGDGPQADDKIGAFHNGPVLGFEETPGNQMDAALATVNGNEVLPFLCGIGRITDTSQAEKDDVVYIHGAKSGFSKGIVAKQNVDTWVRYSGNRRARFNDQILIEAHPDNARFARRGDSGALVVKRDLTACALLFAASSHQAWATPIDRVLLALKVSLDTGP